MLKGQAVKRLGKKAGRGFRGFPVATIAFYGPDNKKATKVVVAIVLAAEILTFLDGAGVKTVALADRILGCPHDEVIDYEEPTCPHCPYWADWGRRTGEMLH